MHMVKFNSLMNCHTQRHVINHSCYKMICNNIINVIKTEFLSHNTIVHLSRNRITNLICVRHKKYKSIHSRLTLSNDMN